MIRVKLVCDTCGTAYVPDPDDIRNVRVVARMLGWTSGYEWGRLRDACASCAGKGGAGETTEGRNEGP